MTASKIKFLVDALFSIFPWLVGWLEFFLNTIVRYQSKSNLVSRLSGVSAVSTREPTSDVLKALSQIIDPDFGTDIVSCGFVKDLHVNEASGEVILNMTAKFHDLYL